MGLAELLVGVAGLLLLLEGVEGVVITSYHPSNGPTSGGTEITIRGEEFITTGNSRSKCNFQRADLRGVVFSQLNQILNSTLIVCILPITNFFTAPLPPEGVNVRLSLTAGPGQFSNHMEFLVYDISSILITSVSPTQALTNSSNGTHIVVRGQGFINTGEITCALDAQNATATFINSSSLECDLPMVQFASRIRLVVSLNGQPVGAILSLADIFTFYSPSPLVVSSYFSSSYVEIFILFDREIEVGSEGLGTGSPEATLDDSRAALSLNCSQVLDGNAVSLLGSTAACSWLNSQQRTIVLHLSSQSVIMEHTHLGLNEESLRTRGVLYSRLAGGGVEVISLPGIQLVPTAILEGPTIIPRCGELVIRGERSLYGGARDLQYKWTVGMEVGVAGGVVQDPALQNYVPIGFSARSQLSIPSTAFYSDSTVLSGSGSGDEEMLPLSMYTVQLVVRNYFGYTSLAVSHNVTTTRHLSPSVVIIGGSARRLQAWREVLLEGKVLRVVNECALEFQVASYSWSLGSQPLHGVRTNLSVLVLPPNTLQPGTSYVATFTVTFHTGSLSTSHVSLESEETLEARIAGGVRHALGVGDRINLDGRPSLIHYHPSANLRVSWGCVSVPVLELSQASASCENFTGSDSILHSVPGGSLPPGGYEFTLTLSLVGGRGDVPTLQSSAAQLLALFPNPVPRVEITPMQSIDVDSVLVHRKFSLGAEVSSLAEGRVQWTVEYVEGYGLLQLRTNISHASLQYPICSSLAMCPQSETSISLYTTGLSTTYHPFTNQLALVLRDSLLLPRNSYRFKLSVTDTSGRVGFAEMDIQTESIPTSGRIEVSPVTGWTLSTEFSLRTLGWTDDMGNAPFSYQLGFRYLQSSKVCEEWLTGISGNNDFTLWLPDIDLALVPEVLVRVSDRNGAVQDIAQPFSSLITSHSNEGGSTGMSRLTALIGESQTLITGGHWVQGLSELASLLSSLDLDHGEIICNASQTLLSPKFRLTNGDVISLKIRVLPIVLDLYFTFVPCSQTHYQIILSLLQKVTRTRCQTGLGIDTSWTQADVDGLLGLLESVIGKFNQFSDSGIISRRGFSAEDVSVILSIFEQASRNGDIPNGPVPLFRVKNNITMELSRILPDIGYGLCVRQSIHEEDTAIDLDRFVNMKSSLINLPSDYLTGGCMPGFGCTFEPVRINFGGALLSTFLQWNCSTNGRNSCSGVCLTSSLFHVDLLWQGREFSSLLKTPLLHLSLQNPSSGAPLDVLLSTTSGPVLTFPIISPYSSASNLHCVVWDATSLLWLSGPCTTEEVVVVSQHTRVMCRCSDVGSLFYAVLQRCPSGHYGQTCSQLCPQGLWGSECRETCDCSNRGTCSAVDGSCDCNPGWTGMRCADVCPEGSYGRLCGEACRCQNGATCDHVTGECGCTAGWIGLLCNISCTQDFYGDGCARSCECRNISKCDHITGACTCQAGFTGVTCHDPCTSGSYGLACTLICQCSDNGTRSCDPINGSCDCHDMWTGLLCDIQVALVTSPPPTVPVPPSFQLWWAIVGVALIAVVGVAIVLIVVFVWRKRKRKQVLPLPVSRGNTGKDDATSQSSSDTSDEFVISRTKSLEVLVPPGKSLKDVFLATSPITETGAVVEFKEPLEMHGNFRWQIVRVLSEEGSEGKKSSSLVESRPVSQIQQERKEFIRSASQAKEEERDSRQLEKGNEFQGSENQVDGNKSRVSEVQEEGKESQGSENQVEGKKSRGSEVQEEGKESWGSEVEEGGKKSRGSEEGKESQGSENQVDGNKSQGSEVQEEGKESRGFEAQAGQSDIVNSQGQESEVENSGKDRDTLSQHEQTELAYRGGVYLPFDATLKDLRNRFVDSEQLDHNDGMHFQFLLSDVPGDRIELDTEDEVLLCQIEGTLVQRRTLYIEAIDPSLALGELCVCGRFADLECTSCRKRGYCSKSCQERDWPTHEALCRKVSSRRERRQQRRRSRDQERRISSGSNPPLSEDTCVCGKEAEYECSGCRKQGYCSLACQREDWNLHDYYCRQPGSSSRDSKRGQSYTPMSMQRGKLQTVFEEQESSVEA